MRVHAPKGKLPTDLRAQIAERKAKILAYLGEHSSANRSIPPPIRPRATEAPAPLSFAQERLWFLEQLESQSAVYNICRPVRIGGNLNVSAIEGALNEIIGRHQTLRTAFRLFDGQAVQIVQPSGHLAIDTIDLRSLSGGDRDVEIKRLIKADAEHPFDLHGGSLLRCKLLRVGDAEHILILVTHHAASDAWSMGILTRELWTLYRAYCQGASSPLDPLPVQYSDYAVWQRDWLQGEVLEAQLSYWKEQLKELPILNLPTDQSRKPRQSFSGARVAITLPPELTTGINGLSHRHAVTPFMTLLAAFQVLLYRYSGQEDFALGSPIANRKRTEIEGLIGFFVNTLVLRADFSGNPSFMEVLSRVKKTCIGADANQDLPFEKLVQEIQPERDQSRNPLFQVMFVLQNATRPFSGIPGLRIEPVETAATRSLFDLSLFLREREGRYIGFFEYSTDLFNRDRIERMVGHFQTLLEAAVSKPDKAVATLPILTEPERQQILVEWNDTTADYPKDKCIHQLFEEQVERTPDAIAVEFEDQQITYGELNRRTNQLAHHLIGIGIGPESLVGICVERSVEMVVGLLGILKAGGAYVPLDPGYPEERLRFMMEDAQVSVLLTQAKLLEDREWPVLSEVKGTEDREVSKSGEFSEIDHHPPSSILDPRPTVVCIDRDWPSIAQLQDDNPEQPVKSGNLAYVIYTSGSTGKPKGVAIEHRNTSNLLHWAKTVYADDELRSVLASTSICFDLSVFELFVTLSSGGKVVLVENELCLRDHSPDSDITLINTVPSVMSALLATAPLPETIRTVNLAGEPLRQELVKHLYELGTVQKVYDLYGPSETTTYSTFALRTIDGPRTIGRPVANTQIYILDSHLQPIPIGVPGELYIGGAGVARGYLNRAELTRNSFIPDPFAGDGSILYKTGDVARYLPDGKVEFLGRADNQVKIRGYRIELGEIETAINQHPGVKDSVVVAHDRGGGAKELVCYVVAIEPLSSLVDMLRTHLTTRLPPFMIPSAFVTVAEFPLTPNGKLDRNALTNLTEHYDSFHEGDIPPRTAVEEMVANIWCDVLHIQKLGVYANFFALGGHSLLAIQIVSRLTTVLKKHVPLRTLFEAPTVAQLSQEVATIMAQGQDPGLPPVTPEPRDRPIPLSLNQEHLWYLDQRNPGTPFFNVPYVYRLTGSLNFNALEKAFKEIIRRHEALRTVFVEQHGRPVQVIERFANFEFPLLDLTGTSPDDVAKEATALILEERICPFNISLSPPIRAKLLRLTDTENLLLITAHHIIVDHWSMRLLRTELLTLYEAFCHVTSSPLPTPIVHFADYACWERRLLNTTLSDQLTYWRHQLANISALSKPVAPKLLDIDCQSYFQFNRHHINVTGTLLERLKVFAAKHSITPFLVVLAAVIASLYRSASQQPVRIGIPFANRRRPEVEATIGHFVNTVLLTVYVPPKVTLKQLLVRVKESVLQIHEYQEFPMEQLMRELECTDKVDRASVFPVLMNYQKLDFESDCVAGLTFAPWNDLYTNAGVEPIFTAFDLIFDLKETSTMLTGTVNARDTSFNRDNAIAIVCEFARTLEAIVSESNDLISNVTSS